MAGGVDKQVRRESLERELRTVRSAIRTFRKAAETAQEQSVLFQLEGRGERGPTARDARRTGRGPEQGPGGQGRMPR